jgi:hypothetical protein
MFVTKNDVLGTYIYKNFSLLLYFWAESPLGLSIACSFRHHFSVMRDRQIFGNNYITRRNIL